MLKGKMLIAHGGGPTPVINTSLLGAIEEAKKHDCIEQILAARHGVEGLLDENFIDLGKEDEEKIQLLRYTPASAIGSCRRKLQEEDYPLILEVFKKHNIRYFFYNGGNDSMDSCNKISILAEKSGYDMKVIGIPKTIDNDLVATDNCPGFASAARYIAECVKELAQDAHSLPIHVLVVEVMGRNAGWLAASAELAKDDDNRGPHLIYLPEIPLDEEKFLADVKKVNDKLGYALVVASEGLVDKEGNPVADSGIVDGFGHVVAGGIGEYLSKLITDKLGIKSRSEKPGLLARNAIKYRSDVDIKEAYDVGAYAVKSAAGGETGFMVAIKRLEGKEYDYSLALEPLNNVANYEKKFPLEWINEEKNGVTKEFVDYCKPLIGGDLPKFTVFEK